MVRLSGVWSLVSFNVMANNISVLQPNGPNPLGKLSITADGYLSVLITTPEKAIPLPEGVKWSNASDSAIADIARPMVAYCGKVNTSYVGEQLVLTTQVDVALNPVWIGTAQSRNVSFVNENGRPYMLLIPQSTVLLNLPVSLNIAWHPCML
jgi:hypothetical protein